MAAVMRVVWTLCIPCTHLGTLLGFRGPHFENGHMDALQRVLLESRGLRFDPLLPAQGPAFTRGLLADYRPALHKRGAGSHRMAAATSNPCWWPQGLSARDRHLRGPLPLCTAPS